MENLFSITKKEQDRELLVDIFKAYRCADGSLHQSELLEKVLESKECSIGDNKLKLLIPRYKDVHWIIEKFGTNKLHPSE